MLTALSLGLLDALAAVLPRPWLYRLAEWAGVASVPFLDRQRQRSRNNLQRVRPDWNVEQLDAAVREVFRETARYYVDAAVFPRRTARQVLDADLEIEGLEHLTTAIENGGVVLASFHLSNPEVPIRALPALGLDATVLIEPLANRRQREALMRRRRSSGVEYVATGTEGVRRALDRLRSGGVVAVLVDRDIQGGGPCLPFFGRQARFPAGAADLALRAEAALLPAYTVRQDGHHFTVRFLPPLELLRSGNHGLDVRTNSADLLRTFEPVLREHCSQWRVFESPWAPCHDSPYVDPADEANNTRSPG